MRYSYDVTWGDMAQTPRQSSWRMLRALRHDPPGLARQDPDRAALFSAALEQSEQLFRAAETTSSDTRPLLLFYGLSQSGRALRAVCDQGDRWARAGGHGITVVGSSVGARLAATTVADQSPGLFLEIARTLDRATLGQGEMVGSLARLGQLGARFPLPGDEPVHRSLRLSLPNDQGPYERFGPLRANLTVPADTWVYDLPPVGLRDTSHYDAYRTLVRDQLTNYPTLSEAHLVDDVPGHFDLGGAGHQREVRLEWPDRQHPALGNEEGALLPFSDERSRHVTVYPRGRDSQLAVHPYLLWWAVLFAMSHYVRYEPTRWASIIDVDRSDEAVAVEHLCDQALDVLPELIHRTLVRGETA